MAHNIDETTGQAAIAFQGSRDDIWHRMGQQAEPGWSVDQWAAGARLNWTAHKVPALADCTNLERIAGHKRVDGGRFLVRSDTGHVLGYVSDRYQPVQPRDVLEWFQRYIEVDPRFQLDVAGALKSGEIIWATATFAGGNGSEMGAGGGSGNWNVAGDTHTARLLMTTTFDGTGSTINRATMTRVVCNNTLNAAMADRAKSVVRTRHSTKFNPTVVGAELSRIVSGFGAYKQMGEAMAQVHVAADMVGRLFKTVLEIPFDAKPADVSKRKMSQYEELSQAWSVTRRERNESLDGATAWTALNAVTRYADHVKSARGEGVDSSEKRFLSANFGGSGEKLKASAIEALRDMCADAPSSLFQKWLSDQKTISKIDA